MQVKVPSAAFVHRAAPKNSKAFLLQFWMSPDSKEWHHQDDMMEGASERARRVADRRPYIRPPSSAIK